MIRLSSQRCRNMVVPCDRLKMISILLVMMASTIGWWFVVPVHADKHHPPTTTTATNTMRIPPKENVDGTKIMDRTGDTNTTTNPFYQKDGRWTRILSGTDAWTTGEKLFFGVIIMVGMELLSILTKYSGRWFHAKQIPVRGKHLDDLRPVRADR